MKKFTLKEKRYNIPAPWTMEPSTWSAKEAHFSAPPANLEIEWVHGYRSHDTRNNLRYTVFGDIVYAAAKFGVVYHKRTHTQRYYQVRKVYPNWYKIILLFHRDIATRYLA